MTVTGVKTSQDLRQATVYVSVLGSEKKRSSSMTGLVAAHGVLQARLSRELRMKRTPLLTFEYDHAVEHGVRMSQLIDGSPRPDATAADLGAVVTDPLPRAFLSRRTDPAGDALGSGSRPPSRCG